MRAFERFWVQARLSYRATYLWAGWKPWLSAVVLRPAMVIATFAFATRYAVGDVSARIAIGLAVFSAPVIVSEGVGHAFVYDRLGGTLGESLCTNVRRVVLWSARAVVHIGSALATFAVGLVLGTVVFELDWSQANLAAVVASVAVILITSTAIGLAIGTIALTCREWVGPTVALRAVLLTMCGIVIPVHELPRPLNHVATAFPIVHALAALRASAQGRAIGAVMGNLVTELIVAVVIIAAAYGLFLAFLRKARETGALNLAEN